MSIVDTQNIKEQIISFYNDNIESFGKSTPDFLKKKRKEAIEYFKEIGLPTTKNENYLYSNLEPIFRDRVSYQRFKYEQLKLNLKEIFSCDVPELNTHFVFLVNGMYPATEEPIKDIGKGVLVGSFAKACQDYPELVEKYFDSDDNFRKDGLVALNTSLTHDGVFIHVPKNVVLETPIQVINLLISEEEIMVQPRNLIIAEENSQAQILVCDHTLSPLKFVSNSVTEMIAKENSVIEYFRLQNENGFSTQLTTTFIKQFRNSNVLTNVLTLHGGFVRNNLYVDLEDESCESNAYGLYFADQAQHVDSCVLINHKKPNCTSTQLYKGIIGDMATAAFEGKIYVAQDAQNTQAFQTNRNILTSDDAKVNSKPQLEIYADDVKCSHGSTVGQLDEDALFYLRARGIEPDEARMLLMFAFADEILSKIKPVNLAERMQGLVNQRLRGELSRCHNCSANCC